MPLPLFRAERIKVLKSRSNEKQAAKRRARVAAFAAFSAAIDPALKTTMPKLQATYSCLDPRLTSNSLNSNNTTQTHKTTNHALPTPSSVTKPTTKTFTYTLPPPSNLSTAEKTAYLSILRARVTDLQSEINTFLTEKMDEDRAAAQAVEREGGKTGRGIDEGKEEERMEKGEDAEEEGG